MYLNEMLVKDSSQRATLHPGGAVEPRSLNASRPLQ